MFKKSAQFYDLIYSWKDYTAESEQIHAWVQQHKQSAGSDLLDVACGTGQHLSHLQAHYTVEGLDLDDQILGIARERLPAVPFYEASMIDFDLGKTYDVITCLFGAIAYVQTVPKLRQTLANMYRHLRPGGVAVVEDFIAPERWQDRHVHARVVDEPGLKIVRMNNSKRQGNLVTLEFHYLVGTPDEIHYFVEQHDTGMFSAAEFEEAFRMAGFEVQVIPNGFMENRSVYLGLRPSD